MCLTKRTCSAMSPFASDRTCPLRIMCICFVALDRSLRPRERAEAEARLDPPFDRTVILLDNVVEVRDDATATSLAECMSPLQFVNNTGIRRVPVDIDHPRARMTWRC